MCNHITVSVEFYFKGNLISSVVELDLDQHMSLSGKLPALYQLLAREIGLDLYSYEYEMLQAETIRFNNAKGLAADYVTESAFDINAFEKAWIENTVIEKLQDIAKKNLAIDNLQQHDSLKRSLLEAYRLGKKTTS